jgi:hypothetical protein
MGSVQLLGQLTKPELYKLNYTAQRICHIGIDSAISKHVGGKSIITWPSVKNFLRLQFMNVRNKLECLSFVRGMLFQPSLMLVGKAISLS